MPISPLPPLDPGETVRMLGSLASMISAYIAVRREKRDLTEADRRKIIATGKAAESRDPSQAAVHVVEAISIKILEPYQRRIQRVIVRYTEAIDHLNPLDADDVQRRAIFEICKLLEMLKRHNRGKVPPEFEWVWNDFGCAGSAEDTEDEEAPRD
jgi:hypothetical protein